MATFRELFKAVKYRIREIDVRQLQDMRQLPEKPVVIDVREQDEVEQGMIPGAIHIPRGYLEQRVEQQVPEYDVPVVVHCASGIRSAFATETLQQMGYTEVINRTAGLGPWKQAGLAAW